MQCLRGIVDAEIEQSRTPMSGNRVFVGKPVPIELQRSYRDQRPALLRPHEPAGCPAPRNLGTRSLQRRIPLEEKRAPMVQIENVTLFRTPGAQGGKINLLHRMLLRIVDDFKPVGPDLAYSTAAAAMIPDACANYNHQGRNGGHDGFREVQTQPECDSPKKNIDDCSKQNPYRRGSPVSPLLFQLGELRSRGAVLQVGKLAVVQRPPGYRNVGGVRHTRQLTFDAFGLLLKLPIRLSNSSVAGEVAARQRGGPFTGLFTPRPDPASAARSSNLFVGWAPELQARLGRCPRDDSLPRSGVIS